MMLMVAAETAEFHAAKAMKVACLTCSLYILCSFQSASHSYTGKNHEKIHHFSQNVFSVYAQAACETGRLHCFSCMKLCRQ